MIKNKNEEILERMHMETNEDKKRILYDQHIAQKLLDERKKILEKMRTIKVNGLHINHVKK